MTLQLSADSNFWRYSSEFNYRKYFETQSHADTIIKAIDRDIAETAVGLRDLRQGLGAQISAASERISSEISAVGEKINLGFIEIDRSLKEIDSSISSMHFDVVEGLQNIEFRLEAISSNLTRIEDILRNPEKTWAFEMLREAERLYIMGDITGSLFLLNRIIEGDSFRPGIRTEWQLHYLRAKCLMGGLPNYDPKVEDRKGAILAFRQALKCAQFIGVDRKLVESDLLWQIGWANFTLGNNKESLAAFSEAFERNQKSGISLYEISKIYFSCHDISNGRRFLRRAAEIQPIIFDRAAGDKIMIENKRAVIEEKNNLRARYLSRIDNDSRETAKVATKFFAFEHNLQEWKRFAYSEKQTYALEFSNDFRTKIVFSSPNVENHSEISLVDMHRKNDEILKKCVVVPELTKRLESLLDYLKSEHKAFRIRESYDQIDKALDLQKTKIFPAFIAAVASSWILPVLIMIYISGDAPFNGVKGWYLFGSIAEMILTTVLSPLIFFGGIFSVDLKTPPNYYQITIGIFAISFTIYYFISNQGIFTQNQARIASQNKKKRDIQSAHVARASLLDSISDLSKSLSSYMGASRKWPGA